MQGDNLVTTDIVLVSSLDDEIPRAVLLYPVLELVARREEVEHFFQGDDEEEEEIFNSASIMPTNLLKIGGKPSSAAQQKR